MKKGILVLFSLVALLGILNCVLIEPAFACKDEAPHSEQSGDSDCCFIHCSMHHQWVTAGATALTFNSASAGDYVLNSNTFQPDSPVASIFHPPLAI
ncbi:MAG: hypothetical protein Q8R76_06165 [Candidatus Omnitrophota bacterium]|nr:hypothetical protein [Candidatus Omnitrophota bacterium]